MGWKNIPYWLKGLFFGIGISIILFIFQAFSGLACMGAWNSNEPSLVCDPIHFLYSLEFIRMLTHPVFVLIISILIGWFIGWKKKS